jgi:XTP/dITP diphosphohydrolase
LAVSLRQLCVGDTLVIATHNPGKLQDLGRCFPGLSLRSAAALGIPENSEEGDDFRSIAAEKALFSASFTGLPSVSDDCGLCIEALGNEPGIFSKRHALRSGGWEEGMSVLWDRVKSGGKGTAASFHCALALAFPDGSHRCVEGVVLGEVIWPPRGSHGSGYDSFFRPRGESKTFGEMDDDERSRKNHRHAACVLLGQTDLLNLRNSVFRSRSSN